jgi:glucose 1-dehydrogenase
LKPLADRVALVTGSTRGLGRVIASRLAAEGATIVVSGRAAADVDTALNELRGEGASATGIPADLADPEEAHRLGAAAVAAFGRLDILVNNAGMSRRTDAWRLSDESWQEQVNVNLRSPFILAQHAARAMIDGGRGGRIVNISTIGARASLHDAIAYDSAKGGLEAMTRDLAVELGRFGITVNAVAPGAVVDRPGQDPVEAEAIRGRHQAAIPLGRVGRAEDVAAAVSFFCSPDAEWITGQVLGVDGGHRLYLNDGLGIGAARP